MKQYLLTPTGLGKILKNTKQKIEDYPLLATKYVRMMWDNQFLPCYKCNKRIEIGSIYITGHKSTLTYGSGKYYHPICYERLHH